MRAITNLMYSLSSKLILIFQRLNFKSFFGINFGTNYGINSKELSFTLTWPSASGVSLCRNGDCRRSSVVSLVGTILSFGERVLILVGQLFTAAGNISHEECSKGVFAWDFDGEELPFELSLFSKSWWE